MGSQLPHICSLTHIKEESILIRGTHGETTCASTCLEDYEVVMAQILQAIRRTQATRTGANDDHFSRVSGTQEGRVHEKYKVEGRSLFLFFEDRWRKEMRR